MKFRIQQTRTDKAGFDQLARLHHETKDLLFGDIELEFATCSSFDSNWVPPSRLSCFLRSTR